MHAFATALVIGLLVLGVASVVDVRRDRSALRRMLAARDGSLPSAAPDSPDPAFVDADRLGNDEPAPLTTPEAATIAAWQQQASRVDARLTCEALATRSAPATAILHDALVLCVGEPLPGMRELMGVAARAVRSGRPLLVVAPDIGDDVLDTLRVNLRAGRLTACALLADVDACTELARLTGTRVASRAELQAGGVPDDALGRVPRVVATANATWVGEAN